MYLPFAVISSNFTVTETEQHSIGLLSTTTGCTSCSSSLTLYVEAVNPTEISKEQITKAANA